jgi:negative regulator of sigma E activity
MPDDPQIPPDAVDDGELLAAYLDGETDDVTTARLERRLTDDPELAERLDAIAVVRVRMQRLSEITAPDAARQRLRVELARARGGDDPAVAGAPLGTEISAPAPGDDAVQPRGHRRRWWWTRRPGSALAAAAVVAVAVFGVATLLRPVGGGISEEALVADDDTAVEAAGTDDRAADEAGSAALEEQADEAAGDTTAARAPAAAVDGDGEIAARARELQRDPPDDLLARERRLREGAGLPTERLCVAELDAVTVDLVDEDGRVALAVLLSDVDEIVLLVPRTCAAIRTIPAAR